MGILKVIKNKGTKLVMFVSNFMVNVKIKIGFIKFHLVFKNAPN